MVRSEYRCKVWSMDLLNSDVKELTAAIYSQEIGILVDLGFLYLICKINMCAFSFRLQDYERNKDFRSDPITLPADICVNWPTTWYSQISLQSAAFLPPVTESHVTGYVLTRIGLDKRTVGDAKALVKGRTLLESKKVAACSYVLTTTDSYFSAVCRAAMKSGVSHILYFR